MRIIYFFTALIFLPLQVFGDCPGMDFLVNADQVSCYNGHDGRIEIITTNLSQNKPYLYAINGGGYQLAPVFNGLSAGNYILKVKDNLGCEFIYPQTITLSQPDSIRLDLKFTPAVCGNDAKVYAELQGGIPPFIYQWNNNPVLQMDTLRNVSSGLVQLQVRDQNLCIAIDTLTIPASDSFTATITIDKPLPIQIGDPVILQAALNRGSGNYSYQWFPDNNLDCTNCNQTSARFFANTNLKVIVHDLDLGCVAQDTIHITVDGTFSFYVPNAFSPNQDSKNDRFLIYGVGIDSAAIQIYDSKGLKVYDGDVLTSGWNGNVNGRAMPEGVYFYFVRAIYSDMSVKEQRGQINLIR